MPRLQTRQTMQSLEMEKVRLDILVQQQAGVSRAKAQGLILAGQVFLGDGQRADKPGMHLPPETPLQIRQGPRFVSRGGEKLDAAMAAFALDIAGETAIDVGASTGGFTDCLLQRGAARVYAVDVGYGQLAWELRRDARVVVLERCNIRTLSPEQLPERPTFFTVDCSFISLRLVLPPLLPLLGAHPRGVALIKPQFEAGREHVGKGGVVRDAAVHAQVIEEIRAFCVSLGFVRFDVIPSPLLGPAGNREFLAYLQTGT